MMPDKMLDEDAIDNGLKIWICDSPGFGDSGGI
jgi:hypothetical protein